MVGASQEGSLAPRKNSQMESDLARVPEVGGLAAHVPDDPPRSRTPAISHCPVAFGHHCNHPREQRTSVGRCTPSG